MTLVAVLKTNEVQRVALVPDGDGGLALPLALSATSARLAARLPLVSPRAPLPLLPPTAKLLL